MDDNVSTKSSDDSVTTSGEYEIVSEHMASTVPMPTGPSVAPADGAARPASSATGGKSAQSPTLRIANNGDLSELEKNMHEVICDDISVSPEADPGVAASNGAGRPTMSVDAPKRPSFAAPAPPSAAPIAGNPIGRSVFYDCIDLSPMSPEKQDTMKADDRSTDTGDESEELSDIDQDCTIFAGVVYLGAATINAPKSHTEILRNMSEMNASSTAHEVGMNVSVSIPVCSEGFVVLHDAASNAVIATYEVQRILFYARGPLGSESQACFAFTWSHGESQESAAFQCHIFKCQIPEAVTQVSACFAKAFQRVPVAMSGSVLSANIAGNDAAHVSQSSQPNAAPQAPESPTGSAPDGPPTAAQYEFVVSLEIRERLVRNGFAPVDRDRSAFRLRCNTDKEIAIAVRLCAPAAPLQPLCIERCFGVLLSTGKLIRQSDMQLLDMVSMGYQQPLAAEPVLPLLLRPYAILAEWKSTDPNFERLNAECSRMDVTVAIDLVIKDIQEPVRIVLETPVAILPSESAIMKYLSSGGGSGVGKSMIKRYYLHLRRPAAAPTSMSAAGWEVSSIDPSDEIVESVAPAHSSSIFRNLGLPKMVRSASLVSSGQFEDNSETPPSDEDSGGDEPLLSGTGEVSKDCTLAIMDEWRPMLAEWQINKNRPKGLAALVRQGVPEALRGNVWQRLANVDDELAINEYRLYLTEDTACENVIKSDIHRTYPAHKFFMESGGTGQEALFKVAKAYAVHDKALGYCQGQSFVAATLLLHMPEEQAFNLLIKLMFEYGLRDMYMNGFEMLYLHLYQLNRLIKEQLPRLYEHFEAINIETHMFASQWFLTLFTARFPLYFVFHVLDVFLLDGKKILFQVSLALLAACESDLRALDFEGVMKYVRVTLPKKCRSPTQARRMMKNAVERKVKKLCQYEEEYNANKKQRTKQAQTVQRSRFSDEERQRMQCELIVLQSKYDDLQRSSKAMSAKESAISTEYKRIIQRQEQQLSLKTDELNGVRRLMDACAVCSATFDRTMAPNSERLPSAGDSIDAPLGPLDPLTVERQRVRELEQELAQKKLALVEAECRNQDLVHQLTLIENQMSNRNSWQPWLSKTINTIQERVSTRRDTASFQSYMPSVGQTAAEQLPADMLRTDAEKRDARESSHHRLQTTLSLGSANGPLLDDNQQHIYGHNSLK